MAEVTYSDNNNELSPSATQHFYDNEPPIPDVKRRGRPRKFANDEERLQYYKDNKYNLKYYHKNIKKPHTCDTCGRVYSSINALTSHKINNNKCVLLKETLEFLNSEQRAKLKEMIYKQ